MVQNVDLKQIGGIPLFDGLPDDDMVMLLDHATRVELDAEETLFVQDEPADAMFLINSGQIGLYIKSRAGRELLLATLGPGNVLGEIGLLVGGTRTATARALEPASVLRLPDSQLHKLLEGNSIPAYRFVLNLARVLATRLRAADGQIAELCAEVNPPLVAEDDLDRLRKIFFSDWGGGQRTS